MLQGQDSVSNINYPARIVHLLRQIVLVAEGLDLRDYSSLGELAEAPPR